MTNVSSDSQPRYVERSYLVTAFEKYLALYEIDAIKLSIAAQVRYLTIYNAKQGNPITPENAQKIKETVLKLTGVAYTGSFNLLQYS